MPVTYRNWFHRITFAVILSLVTPIFAVPPPLRAQERPARLLYFTHSAGYRHDVIPASRDILKQIGARVGFEVTASEDVAVFTPENLQRYGAVIFFTTGELPMSNAQQHAFTDFIRAGNGFLGVHSATDTFYQWPEYLKVIGGYFDQHPWHQTVTVEVADRGNPLVAFLGKSFVVTDEIYQIRDFDAGGSHALLRLDPASVDLTQPNVHRHSYGWPLAWTRSYGGGRVFYTALGHEEGVWRDYRFQQMLRNGPCDGHLEALAPVALYEWAWDEGFARRLARNQPTYPIMEHDAVNVESTSGLANSHEIRTVNCFSGAYLAMRR